MVQCYHRINLIKLTSVEASIQGSFEPVHSLAWIQKPIDWLETVLVLATTGSNFISVQCQSNQMFVECRLSHQVSSDTGLKPEVRKSKQSSSFDT